MAKKVYHIPLQKTLTFITTHKSTLNKLMLNPQLLEYHKNLGKSYFSLEIEVFINFFKIEKEMKYALSTMEYFHSQGFIDEASTLLNFSQFALNTEKVSSKDFFYAFCLLFHQDNHEDFTAFIQKLFLHYHTAFNSQSNIIIDYQALCHALLKSQNKTLRESFGEEKEEGFFRIYVDEILEIEEKGKGIKTLRKKAYKKFFLTLL